MGSSVVVGVFVIMLATVMMSQLPSTSHCLMNKSSSSTASFSNWCINGSTHQYCQQLIIPRDVEEGVDDLELEPMNMIMKHMPVDDSHHETSNRMLFTFNNMGFTGKAIQRGPTVTCDRRGYGPCIPNPTENKHGVRCKSAYARPC
ncbi:hypothetical protein GBA52_011599 [Prunus armeniaca]|nr:hypothetical protein GBA52_011599 [Prunus armeniaca]